MTVYGDGVNVAARIEPLASRAGSWYRARRSTICRASSTSRSNLPASSRSRTSAGRCGPTGPPRRHCLAPPPTPLRRRLSVSLRSLAAASWLVVLAVAGWWFWSTPSVPPARASVAVLPFDNLGGDEATGRLADGMTEDLITELTRFRALDVIARDSTPAYRDKAADVRAGRPGAACPLYPGRGHPAPGRARADLGAIGRHHHGPRCLVRAVGPPDQRRVRRPNASLPNRRQQDRGPLFREIIAVDREAAKRKPPSSLTAYDLYLLGMELQGQPPRESLQTAIPLLQAQPRHRPQLLARLDGPGGDLCRPRGHRGYPADIQQAREAAARKGVALDPADAQAHAALATYYMDSGDPARAEAEFDKALRPEPRLGRSAFHLCRLGQQLW